MPAITATAASDRERVGVEDLREERGELVASRRPHVGGAAPCRSSIDRVAAREVGWGEEQQEDQSDRPG